MQRGLLVRNFHACTLLSFIRFNDLVRAFFSAGLGEVPQLHAKLLGVLDDVPEHRV